MRWPNMRGWPKYRGGPTGGPRSEMAQRAEPTQGERTAHQVEIAEKSQRLSGWRRPKERWRLREWGSCFSKPGLDSHGIRCGTRDNGRCHVSARHCLLMGKTLVKRRKWKNLPFLAPGKPPARANLEHREPECTLNLHKALRGCSCWAFGQFGLHVSNLAFMSCLQPAGCWVAEVGTSIFF